MNILVPFIREHPESLDELVRAEGAAVSFGELVEVIAGRGGFPFNLDGVLGEGPIEGLLQESYLRVASRGLWEERMASASEPPPAPVNDWVTFVEMPTTAFGVTLPDDGSPTMRVSLFARVGAQTRRVSVEYMSGLDSPSALSTSLDTSCSLPDWGECQTTECHGGCELRRKHDDNDGLVCWCPHSS